MEQQLELMFSEDPLYRFCQRLGMTTEDIIDEHMGELVEGLEYTTTRFEEWYSDESKPEKFLAARSTMRLWLGELSTYIQPRRPGRNLVLDYKAVFRLRLALLLRSKDIKINKVQELAGILPTVIHSDERMEVAPEVRGSATTPMLEQAVTALMQSGLFAFVEGKLEINANRIREIVGQQPQALPGEIASTLEEIHASNEFALTKIQKIEYEMDQKSKEQEKIVEELKQQKEKTEIELEEIQNKYLESVRELEALKEKHEKTFEEMRSAESKTTEQVVQMQEKIDLLNANSSRGLHTVDLINKRRKLRLEAQRKWENENGLMKRLLAKDSDKEEFIEKYIDEHMPIE